MKTNYHLGDFVRLVERDRFIEFSPKEIKPFQISSIKIDKVQLNWNNAPLSFDDIEPIPINGKDDKEIYISFNKSYLGVVDGQDIQFQLLRKTYYFTQILEMQELDELINDLLLGEIRFVHEVQHYIRHNNLPFLLKTD